MQPVHALGFQDFIQTHAEQNHLRFLCNADRFFDHALIRQGILPVKALGIACNVHSGGNQAVIEIVQLCGIDLAGSSALVSGCFGEVADDCGFGFFLQRENAVVVQQDDGACGAFFRNGMVGIHIEGFGCGGHGFGEGENLFQQLSHPLVQHLFRNSALLNRLDEANGAVRARGGHHQIGTGFYALSVIVVSAPVGDHEAVKAPLTPKNLRQQVGIFVGVGTVHLVIAGHDGLCAAFLYGDFKGGQVNLPQGALVHHGVHGHPPQLLGIDGKVLGTGGGTITLNAPDIGSSHLTGEIRILGEILKVPPAQG